MERTPLAQQRDWCGELGFVEFWASYQGLCQELLRQNEMPVEWVSARHWTRRDRERLADAVLAEHTAGSGSV